MAEADLVRFLDAQSDVYEEVTKELTEGQKQTHWMWLIFPQLRAWATALWRNDMRSAI